MPNDSRATKAQRQAAARARAAELRRQQERTAKRNRFIAIGAAVLVVIVVVVTIGVVVIQNHRSSIRYASVSYGGADSESQYLVRPNLSAVKAPSAANSTGGIPVSANGVGKEGSGSTVLQVYFDLQCPGCAQVDSVNAADLQTLSQEQGITVVYQPLDILNRFSQGTRYSSRAGNAAMVVADQDPHDFPNFITALYAKQPTENSNGLPDSQIASIASSVGVPQTVIDQFTATVSGTYQLKDNNGTTDHTGTWRTFTPFLAAAIQQASQQPWFANGVQTPTIVLNGTQIGAGGSDGVSLGAAGSLKSYVEKVNSQAASQ
ncbi:MAG: thioredoxin domain-containing protein [Micrococcales bacterium]|nr:thioredoxin domain-containing protein [Micrococcales bacterium]